MCRVSRSHIGLVAHPPSPAAHGAPTVGSDQSSAALPAPLGWMFQRGGDRQRAVPGFPEGGVGWSECPAWTPFVAPACYQACPYLAARWGRAEVGLASGWAGAGTGAHRGACGKEGKARPLTLLHALYLQYHLLLPGHLTGSVSGGFLSALSLKQFMATCSSARWAQTWSPRPTFF